MSQTDIVARLRESGSQDCIRGEPWRSQVKDEAADTITQLRERLEQTTKEREEALGYEIKLRAERDQLRLSNERMERAIRDEPELPGEMPDEVWNAMNGNREQTTLFMQFIVKATKRNILAKAALTAESGTEIDPTHPKGE